MKKAVEWVLNLVTTVIAQACSLDAKYVTIQGGGDWDKMTSIVKEWSIYCFCFMPIVFYFSMQRYNTFS